MSIIDRYLEIFSDPFFWVLAVILSFVFLVVYREFIHGHNGTDEEVEQLVNQLSYYQLVYLDSQPQKTVGPFTENEENEDLFFDESIPKIYTYRTVKAKNIAGKELDFWVKIEYASNRLTAISWNPNIETIHENTAAQKVGSA